VNSTTVHIDLITVLSLQFILNDYGMMVHYCQSSCHHTMVTVMPWTIDDGPLSRCLSRHPGVF